MLMENVDLWCSTYENAECVLPSTALDAAAVELGDW